MLTLRSIPVVLGSQSVRVEDPIYQSHKWQLANLDILVMDSSILLKLWEEVLVRCHIV